MTFLTDKISAVEPTDWDAEITAKMQAAGFCLENMGGNTQAWKRDAGNIYYLISYSDGFAFGNPEDGAWDACLYYGDPENDPYICGEMLTLDKAVAAAKEPRQ